MYAGSAFMGERGHPCSFLVWLSVSLRSRAARPRATSATTVARFGRPAFRHGPHRQHQRVPKLSAERCPPLRNRVPWRQYRHRPAPPETSYVSVFRPHDLDSTRAQMPRVRHPRSHTRRTRRHLGDPGRGARGRGRQLCGDGDRPPPSSVLGGCEARERRPRGVAPIRRHRGDATATQADGRARRLGFSVCVGPSPGVSNSTGSARERGPPGAGRERASTGHRTWRRTRPPHEHRLSPTGRPGRGVPARSGKRYPDPRSPRVQETGRGTDRLRRRPRPRNRSSRRFRITPDEGGPAARSIGRGSAFGSGLRARRGRRHGGLTSTRDRACRPGFRRRGVTSWSGSRSPPSFRRKPLHIAAH